MQLPLLGLLVAALAAPADAQVAETVSMDSCQDALWSGLPLAKQQTPSDSYNPTVGVLAHIVALPFHRALVLVRAACPRSMRMRCCS